MSILIQKHTSRAAAGVRNRQVIGRLPVPAGDITAATGEQRNAGHARQRRRSRSLSFRGNSLRTPNKTTIPSPFLPGMGSEWTGGRSGTRGAVGSKQTYYCARYTGNSAHLEKFANSFVPVPSAATPGPLRLELVGSRCQSCCNPNINPPVRHGDHGPHPAMARLQRWDAELKVW